MTSNVMINLSFDWKQIQMAGEIFVNTRSSRQDELEIVKRTDGNTVK